MDNKLCLITGASAGIGKATAIGLAKMGARIIVHARNEKKAIATCEEVKTKSENPNIEYLSADLGSFSEIKSLVEKFNQKYSALDVLINNAGCIFTDYAETVEGIERQWCINHLAPFLLTNLLLPKLKAAPSARIVNVSSGAHTYGKINFEDINHSKNYKGMKVYSQSKLANVLFTIELAKRLEGTKITANSLHPGAIKTDIGSKNNQSWMSKAWSFFKPFMKSIEKGAETSIYLASSPEVEGKTGGYYGNKKLNKTSKLGEDAELAKKLWAFTEESIS